MNRTINAIKKYGILGLIIKFMNKLSYKIFKFFNRLEIKVENKYKEKLKKKDREQYDNLERLMKSKKYKYIFIFYPYTEWELPVFQRPQQIALSLSERKDVLYLYCTTNYNYDKIEGLYRKINDNLYVVTDYEFIKGIKTNNRILHLYSTDITTDYSVVEEALSNDVTVLYEYIDEIHESITQSAPKYYLEKHKKILKNEECYVVVTADKLEKDLLKYRKKNYVLSTNGVTVDHFITDVEEVDERIAKLKKKYKKIICYYGSLAVWFDYKLLIKAAKKYPNYAFLLIGMIYDESFEKSGIEKQKNIIYIGKVPYDQLINITKDVDLLTIPFLINEVTESTSPVKLFEYMATQKPILTTDMNECRKYKSVVIGKDNEDFIKKIDSTIEKINDKEYLELEMKEALENTWESKANLIVEMLDK